MKSLAKFKLEISIGLITLIGWFIATLFVISKRIEFKDALSSSVLWLTAWLVVYYSVETMRLRVVSGEQLKTQFMPIIFPGDGFFIEKGKIHVELKNAGQGIAANVKLYFDVIKINETLTVPSKEAIYPEISTSELDELVINANKKLIKMAVKYNDIDGNSYETINISLQREDSNRLVVRKGLWNFKRI